MIISEKSEVKMVLDVHAHAKKYFFAIFLEPEPSFMEFQISIVTI
jgi:hypothetical protein